MDGLSIRIPHTAVQVFAGEATPWMSRMNRLKTSNPSPWAGRSQTMAESDPKRTVKHRDTRLRFAQWARKTIGVFI